MNPNRLIYYKNSILNIGGGEDNPGIPYFRRAQRGLTALGLPRPAARAYISWPFRHGRGSASGRMAEWLCRGLQIPVQRFDSASGLHGLTPPIRARGSAS